MITRLAQGALGLLLATALGAGLARGQAGDIAGEPQPERAADREPSAAAAALSPEQELATFSLPAGLAVELVAAEPLVEAPVQAVFDEAGRLWVVEMRGYMRDVDGTGERAPTGRISVLRDDDGDGRMDRAERFLENLVLPRAVAPTRGGALVLSPPDLLFCTDADGDGVAEEKIVVDTGLAGIASPEYGPNGLLPTLDNAFQCACHDVRYRFVNGQWGRERTGGGGQWGITKDDLGRIFTNQNSDLLRGDFEPSQDLVRNPAVDPGPLVDAEVAVEQTVFPARPTPGVNRAYREGWLAEGRLRRADAACAPWIHRGDALPAEYRGNAFVCEPAGNLVKRLLLEKVDDLRLRARNAYADRELLTSTDERFRPVSLADGPDGALYVVDLYRGVLQHRNFMTTYLRRQIGARGLGLPVDRGRIWRIVPAGWKRPRLPRFSPSAPAELVAHLESQNGWTRDTAQRLLLELDLDRAGTVRALAALATGKAAAIPRIHALWTLAGLGAVDAPLAAKLLADRDADVRHDAIRASEPLLERDETAIRASVIQETMGKSRRLRVRAFLSLSGRVRAALVAGPLARDAEDQEVRRAALSGIGGHTLEFLNALLDTLKMPDHASWTEGLGRGDLVREGTAALVREGRTQDLDAWFGTVIGNVRERPWILCAIVDGALEARPKGPRGAPGYVRLSGPPRGALALRAHAEESIRSKAEELLDLLAWPGREDAAPEAAVRPLSQPETAAFERGRTLFAEVCAACHLPSGRGEPGKAPPLRDSEWVLGDPRLLARIVLGGLEGPLRAGGRDWSLSMPAWNASDEDLAAVLTYVRREWSHGADPATVEDVRAAREATKGRTAPYTVAALAAIARAGQDLGLPPGAPAPELLFDGRSLSGWREIGDARWSAEDGALRGRTGGGSQSFLATERRFGDFVLEADVRARGAGNSGIQVRSRQDEKGRVVGWQVEIDPSERAFSAGLYDEGRRGWLADLQANEPARKAFRREDWNRYRIECIGARVRTWLNGTPAVDHLDPADLEGFVALQVHSGKDTDVSWKDLRLVDLGTRRWEPLFTAEAWRAAAGGGARKLAARFELEDFSARIRSKGLGFRLLARSTADMKRGVDVRTLAPGISASVNGWWIEAAHLALPEGAKPDAEHELAVTLLGDRIAVHLDGRILADAVGEGPRRGSLIVVADDVSGFPSELLGAELMSEPRR